MISKEAKDNKIHIDNELEISDSDRTGLVGKAHAELNDSKQELINDKGQKIEAMLEELDLGSQDNKQDSDQRKTISERQTDLIDNGDSSNGIEQTQTVRRNNTESLAQSDLLKG